MKKINENDFVMLDNEVAVCINDSKYEGFDIVSGMIIVDKELAIKAFEILDGTILDAKSDVVVSYKDGNIFIGYVKMHNTFERIAFRVVGYAGLRVHLMCVRGPKRKDEIASTIKEILSWHK